MSDSNGTTETIEQPESAPSGQASATVQTFQEYCGRASKFAQENPTTAVMTVFAVGLGVGAVVGGLIAQPAGRSRASGLSSMADDIGKKIAAAVGEVLPDTLRS